MKILCIGDIVGKPGRDAVEQLLPGLKEEYAADLVVANAENSAGGLGISARIAGDLLKMGCDTLTLGDHVWDKQDIIDYLKENNSVIRPANFPEGTPGKGWCFIKSKQGKKVGIINLLGRVFMRYNVNCPFRTLEAIVKQLREETNIILVDMHAEATSEKVALGHFIDGKVSAVFGTHTHVSTADETVLPKGTAYITDLGMTGPHDSVIGQNKEKIIERFISCIPNKLEVATGDVYLNGVVIDIDEETGKAQAINRIRRRLSETTT